MAAMERYEYFLVASAAILRLCASVAELVIVVGRKFLPKKIYVKVELEGTRWCPQGARSFRSPTLPVLCFSLLHRLSNSFLHRGSPMTPTDVYHVLLVHVYNSVCSTTSPNKTAITFNSFECSIKGNRLEDWSSCRSITSVTLFVLIPY